MARPHTVAKQYATAFIALHRDDMETMLGELDKLLQYLANQPQIWMELNQNIDAAVKAEDLQERFPWLSQGALALLRLVVEHERTLLLPEIVAELRSLRLMQMGIERLTVSSAIALADSHKKDLQIALEKRLGRQANIRYVVDPQVIGGLVITGDAWELDLSLRAELTKLKAQLVSGGVERG